MALSPFLNEIGRKAAEAIDSRFETNEVCASLHANALLIL